MRSFLFLFFIIFSFSEAFSQSQKEIVSPDIIVKSKPIPDSDSMEVTFTLKVKNLLDMEWIEFRYGSEKGLGDLISMNLQYVLQDGNEYLQYYDNLFPIVNGEVVLKGVAVKDHLNNPSFLIITAKDTKGNEVSKVSK